MPLRRLHMQVISDIHLEFIEGAIFQKIVRPVAPNLAICGDLGLPYVDSYDNFLSKCSQNFKNVFLIAGNHEYYQWKRKEGQKMTMGEVDSLIETLTKKYANVRYLNNKYHVLDNKFAIIGTTLWSEIKPINYYYAQNGLNDYNQIYSSPDMLITPRYTDQKFTENSEWLQKTMDELRDKKLIIMSHHLPSKKLIHKKYGESPLNCCFASDLEHLMKGNVKYWLSGHTHSSFNMRINNTTCIVNPKGYRNENPAYDPAFKITIDEDI
ncbi:MAG: metallophosphatase [Hyperionvirus sp.]|uniref:Metallophosphatase n=1 Tax=Hyperionvirus sp. TaxID=2487770 RepID=A0A3G5A8H0_9VIRU|nr:MAG: metallophosphatase [Hyperionvirus sp.]